jgi:hypothetical protein
MPRGLFNTVEDIIFLLGISGNTKEYKTRKAKLNDEEVEVLRKLKAKKAKQKHLQLKERNDRISLSSKSSSAEYYNIADDDDIDDVVEDVANDVAEDVAKDEPKTRCDIIPHECIEMLINDIVENKIPDECFMRLRQQIIEDKNNRQNTLPTHSEVCLPNENPENRTQGSSMDSARDNNDNSSEAPDESNKENVPTQTPKKKKNRNKKKKKNKNNSGA